MKQYQEHHWSLSCPIQWLLFSLHGYLAKLITPLLNMFQTFSNALLFSLPLLWPRCLGFFYWLSPYLNNNQTLKSVPDSVFGPLCIHSILCLGWIIDLSTILLVTPKLTSQTWTPLSRLNSRLRKYILT